MSQEEKMTLENTIIEWFRENKTHRGKWTLIGRICKDLKLETFPFQWAGRGREYDWNVDVAKALNKISKKGHFDISESGRAYVYTFKELEKCEYCNVEFSTKIPNVLHVDTGEVEHLPECPKCGLLKEGKL